MPQDITRQYGPSISQSSTGEAVGHAEDYSQIITSIDPDMTVFLSQFGKQPNATALDWSWTTAGLRPPQKNAYPEKMEYEFSKVGSIRLLHNYQQHVYASGYITDAQHKSKKIYTNDDIAMERYNASLNLARDMEFAIINNKIARAEGDSSTPAITGGVQYFMNKDQMACTVATTGIVTTTADHNLRTGDFVYFNADTMPTGMSVDLVYYVRKLTDKTFQLYDTMEGAVEEITTDKVTPSSAGTNVVIITNNVIALDGNTDFTMDDLNRAMEMVKLRGGNASDAYMSTGKLRHFTEIVNALATTNRKSGDKRLDMVTTTYVGPSGVINAHAHPMYGDKRIDIMDMQYWDLKYFDPIHEVQGLAKTGTYDKFALEGWFGVQATQPHASASIINIKR